MAEKGKWHGEYCPKKKDESKECTCVAGQKGLARSAEGLYYNPHDSTRAMKRRLRQIEHRGKKECTSGL